MLVLPTMTAPAARRRSTMMQSASGTSPAWAARPKVVRIPAVSCRSLTATGTPGSARSRSPAFSAASARAASSSARSAQTVRKAFSSGLCLSMRSRQARVASTDEISPARMAAAVSLALMIPVPVMDEPSHCEPRAGQSARIPRAPRVRTPGTIDSRPQFPRRRAGSPGRAVGRKATSGAFGPWSALRIRPA